MNGKEMKLFLVGLYSSWFAAKRGRENPNAKDKKDATALAASTANQFNYQLHFGYGGDKGVNSPEGKEVLAKLGLS
jgi:hypothetical protein